MSQFNVNNIANELGTGGPDFVGMPTVGGDPVIESGSNSDGEWTRWADGTQLCFGTYSSGTLATDASARSTIVFPVAFTTTANVRTLSRVHSASNNAASPQLLQGEVTSGSVQVEIASYNIGSGTVTNAYGWEATGRWK